MSRFSLEEFLEKDFKWPKLGDKLFLEDTSVRGALISRDPVARRYHLENGYKLAADLLVDQAEAESSRKSVLVYPIIFCYRQFLELTLKEMLEDYGPLTNLEITDKHHMLEYLWRDFRELIRALNVERADDDSIEAVETCVVEFAKIDPVSQTFRYPTSRKGQPFEIEQEGVNLLHLKDVMQAIENYFMGWDGFLDHLKFSQSDF